MFYGWVILGIAVVATIATSPGQSYLVGKFNGEIRAALGVSSEMLSATYGIATFCAAIPLLYVGRLADRFGPRAVMIASAAALGAACWLIGFAQGVLTLGACYFLLRFAGQGALGLSASHSTALWFERRLGTVTGVKSFAMPIAIMVLPGLTTLLIATTGWRTAYGLLGVGVWVLVLPLAILLHRDRPEQIGQVVDGHRPPRAHPDAELIAAAATEQPRAVDLVEDEEVEAPGEVCFTRPEAMATRAYWIVAAAMVANALVGTAIVFHLSDLVEPKSLGEHAEDDLLRVFAIATLFASPVAGVLTDRLAPRWIVGTGTLLLAIHCGLFAAAREMPLAWLAMIALAASQTMIFIAGTTLFARFFGRPHHGAIRASLTFFMVAGTSLGPYLTDVLATDEGYGAALLVFGAATVPIAAAGYALRPPAPIRRVPQAAGSSRG